MCEVQFTAFGIELVQMMGDPCFHSHHLSSRKALGYRIDPRMWSAWEYVKMNARRLYDRYQQTDVTPSVFTPLVRKFALPVQGSKQPGVLQGDSRSRRWHQNQNSTKLILVAKAFVDFVLS